MMAEHKPGPLFSIIIACYKQEALIRETVESALAVTFPDKEIIVVDDASPDGTFAILESYADRVRVSRNQKNLGACENRNQGARIAKGEYLVFLDGDDLLLPWSLDIYAHLIERKTPNIVLARMIFFTGSAPQPKLSDFGTDIKVVEYDQLAQRDHMHRGSASALVVRQDVYASVGGFDASMFPVDIDDLLLSLCYSGKTVQILDCPTVAYRVHANNTIHQVGWLLDTMARIPRKLQQRKYPGGSPRSFKRHEIFGRIACYWIYHGIRTRNYRKSLKLLLNGWLVILFGIWARTKMQITGRSAIQTVSLLAIIGPF